ncbi:MAG: glycosyltransferase [Acidobacteriota bacterium]|nr:glycosyltransferase [Acidobacteriota bacterium]
MPLHVIQLISSQGYYGAETMMVSLARSLEALHCRCTIAALLASGAVGSDLVSAAERQGLRVEVISCRGKWDSGSVYAIKKLMRTFRADILHTHGYKADLYGFVSAMSSSIGLIATCHNWPDKALAMRAYANIDRFALRKFDAVATASPVILKTLIRSGIPEAKLRMIPNGLDLEVFRPGAPALRESLGLGDRPVIGFVGRLVAGKGVQYLIYSAVDVLAHYPDAVFLIVGEGPQRKELEGLAISEKVDHAFRFLGVRSDMANVYASMDMVVLPSLDECMPMCVLEAMACSKPVIATRVGAVPDLVSEGVSGYLLDPKDVRGLSAAIQSLLASPELRVRMGEAGLNRVRESFSSGRVAKQYLDLYEHVLAAAKPRTVAAG